ncbi:unnamed protein product [Arabidopsis thaliana]|uniref:(thale cress) hypothetical protein n=1 Tax=Arabidopsis thaliana TaxID=3702 RepID=A0A7G2FFX7_ARATH|nr:unnamed protein product [Arabidopsis thaliana]
MDTRKIPLFCYWNGCIKDGPDGPFYEGSSPRGIRVDSKIELSNLLDDLHRLTGFEKGKFQIDLIGRYPSIVQQQMVKYVRLPIVDDCSLEMMLEVPCYHPSINSLEVYLEIKPFSDEVTVSISHQSPLESNVPRKRYRQEDASSVNADVNVSGRNTKLGSPPEDNHNGWIEDEESTDVGNSGDNGLHVGMIFRGKDELAKAVKLYSNRRQREYNVFEIPITGTFQSGCKNYCRWFLKAAKTNGNGFKITEYTGPHACKPADVGSDFLAGEIECLVKVQPSLSIVELNNWVKEAFGYTVSYANMWKAKKEAISAILGDLDKSFSVLPKFMAALGSSNKMLLEWQYDLFPDPKNASFRSVFWAFQQSVEGFPHCRPLILVDTVDLSGKYPGKLLVAAGLDAENSLFPLAFAITTQEDLSADTWLFQNNLMTEYVYKAGSTSCKSRFDYYLKKLEKTNIEARRWLDKLPLCQWTLAHDVGGLRFGVVLTTNTIFKTYDFINKDRNLPVTTCILLIFDHLAELFKLRHGLLQESMKNRREVYAKHVMTKLEESITHDVLPLDQSGQRFQVTEVMQVGNMKFFVHRSDRACTCGIWQLYRYPCSHVIAVFRRLNIDHLQYVNKFYNTESFLGVYAADFNPLPGVSVGKKLSQFQKCSLLEVV